MLGVLAPMHAGRCDAAAALKGFRGKEAYVYGGSYWEEGIDLQTCGSTEYWCGISSGLGMNRFRGKLVMRGSLQARFWNLHLNLHYLSKRPVLQ